MEPCIHGLGVSARGHGWSCVYVDGVNGAKGQILWTFDADLLTEGVPLWF
jgi:hypothetical protein